MSGNNPLLLIMIGLPLIGALVLTGMKGASARTVKLVGLLFSLAVIVLAVVLWIEYRNFQTTGGAVPRPLGAVGPEPFGSAFSVDWIPSFGIRFSVGVDGFAVVMIALIALLVPIVLGASWEERLPAGRSVAGYFALLLVLESAMIGVFAATDVFLFYVMFEVMLIPMYFLIGAYGGVQRAYAATKFFLYSLLGGLLMLASIIGLYVASSDLLPAGGTLDWATLRTIAHQIPESTQLWIFAGFAHRVRHQGTAGTAAHLAARRRCRGPGGGRHAAGRRARQGRHLRLPADLPAAAARRVHQAGLADHPVVGDRHRLRLDRGGRPTDLKRFVTFTSIAHFGFIVLGIFAFTTQSISGAVLYMVNHGLATGLLFLIVGMLTARGGSSGSATTAGSGRWRRILGGVFLIASLATIAHARAPTRSSPSSWC